MSDVKKFDEYFKDQFSNLNADVPVHVWENIVAERESRKPKGFWIGSLTGKKIAILAATVIVGTTTIWMLADKIKTKDEKNNAAITKAITPALYQQNKLSEVKTTDQEINNTQNNIAETTTDNTSTLNIVSGNNNTEKNNVPVVINNKDNNTKTKNTTVFNQNNNIPLLDNEEVESDELNFTTQGSLLNRLLFGAEKLTAIQPVTNMALKPRAFPNVAFPDCPIMEKDIAGNKKYFEIYAGPDYGIRTFTDTPNSTYLQKRSESTKFSFAYSAGVRYTRVFKNAMSVRAGINYSQINEKFTFIESNVTQVTYITDPITGEITGQYSVSGSRYKTTYNRYRTFDIPLAIGYEIGNGRFHANINAGAMINIYSWQKGEVLDTLNKPVSITTGSHSPYQYKTNMGVGFTGGISAYYKLTDQMHLLAEPYIRYNLSPMNQEALTLKQKYTTIGLRLGVRFDLP